MPRLFNPTDVVRETIVPLLSYISRALELLAFDDIYAVWDTSSSDHNAYALERSPLSEYIRLLCSVANGEFDFGDRKTYVTQRAKINDTLKSVFDILYPRNSHLAFRIPKEFYLTQLGQVCTRCETALHFYENPGGLINET